jgi:phosphotransferase system, enzyme I, PtsP
LFELDQLMPMVDFVSIGSNDLFQYLYAADRNNERTASRYDPLLPAGLRALKLIAEAAQRHDTQLTLCGEIGGRPLEALALIALGYRQLSMAPSAIGPVKTMVLGLDARAAAAEVERLMAGGDGSIREGLRAFAAKWGVEV